MCWRTNTLMTTIRAQRSDGPPLTLRLTAKPQRGNEQMIKCNNCSEGYSVPPNQNFEPDVLCLASCMAKQSKSEYQITGHETI